MIRINLLNSVTERQGSAVVTVEKKVGSPMSRFLLMGIAVFILTSAVIGWDVISTTRAKAFADAQLVEEKKKAAELEAVMKEQKELENKIKNIDLRIDAIKKLRNEQAGPSAVLESIRERILMTPDIYLDSVDQKGDQLTIKGSSRNESAITQFGRSLEFSSGLFSNLSIETQRKELDARTASKPGVEEPKMEIIDFTIRCAYTPDRGNASDGPLSASNEAGKGSDASKQASAQKVENAKPQVGLSADN
ncbi:MAG: PilN domain-containing protein [Acidobacteriota bacterium]|nr:PilN domain-containing protein [Acidobacteriota bacterium]MDH3531039.1 PilN domain-containing protein [Acidobacteriota bacterium]